MTTATDDETVLERTEAAARKAMARVSTKPRGWSSAMLTLGR